MFFLNLLLFFFFLLLLNNNPGLNYRNTMPPPQRIEMAATAALCPLSDNECLIGDVA